MKFIKDLMGVYVNFDNVNKEIKNLSARVDGLQLEMNERFDKVDDRFRETQEEINGLRKYIERIGKSSLEDTDVLAEEVFKLKRKIRASEKKFEKKLEKVELKTVAG